jgi:hypothetical protein
VQVINDNKSSMLKHKNVYIQSIFACGTVSTTVWLHDIVGDANKVDMESLLALLLLILLHFALATCFPTLLFP